MLHIIYDSMHGTTVLMLMMMTLAQSAVISYVRITPSGHITRTTRNAAACHVSRTPRHVMVVTEAVSSATVGCRLGRMNIYGIMIVDDYKIIC